MRGISIRLSTGALAALLLGVFVVGCGGPKETDDEPVRKGTKKGPTAGKTGGPAKTLTVLGQDKYKYTGTIKGKVQWEGDLPNLEELTTKLQAGMTTNKDYCLHGEGVKPYETTQQGYRIGDNKGLGNVFVWIQAPPGHAFDVPDSQLPALKDVRIHQPHCAFLPHCSVLFSWRYKDGAQVATGQKLVVENDARVGHNSKVEGGPLNGVSDQLLGAWDGKGKIQEATYQLKPERDAVKISCGVHGWMRAYVRVFDHPYAAVSSVGANLGDAKSKVFENLKDPAFGSFEIKGVPVGAKVRLFAWHEELGQLLGNNGEEIELKDTNAKDITAPRR